jgi:RND family efflux transporter MFP subunit
VERKISSLLTGKRLASMCLGLCVLGLCGPTTVMQQIPANSEQQDLPIAPETPSIKVLGKTQCILMRKCIIAPVPLHPVTEVLVEPGSQVKKGQPLVKLDDDEQQAEVRSRQAALENAQIVLKEARRHHKQALGGYETGALPEKTYYETQVGALKAERDERSALAALESAKAELEHFVVTSEIDGVVSWLEVYPGMVSRPGTTVWGEILDLREIDIRCELTFEQVEHITLGQMAEITKKHQKEPCGSARVICVGIAADKKSELVPVLLRMANPGKRLRCEEPVHVVFSSSRSSIKETK